jgi:protein dithiol oxidoreductase (disulfide-forming)
MFRPFVSILLLSLSVAACGGEAPTPDRAQAPQTATPSSNTDTAQQPQAPAQTAESQEAAAAQESMSETTPEERSDASLERLAAMPANQQLPNGKWRAGTSYVPIVPAMPTSVDAGKVEVLEMFAYGCPHCAALEPYFESWLKNKPAYIVFERLPAWGREEARLYYTIEALGRRELHRKVFEAIHPQPNVKRYELLFARNDADTIALQRKFFTANGVSAGDFDKALNSFSMETRLKRSNDLLKRYGAHYEVGSVPSVVVNGKYMTDVGRAGGPSQLLQLINDLAASEQRR